MFLALTLFYLADQLPRSIDTELTACVRHGLTEAQCADAEHACFDKESIGIRLGCKVKCAHGTGRPVTGLLWNLFDYMLDVGDQEQLIILNNPDATPTSAFDAENTTELVFGEEEDANRLAFLQNYAMKATIRLN